MRVATYARVSTTGQDPDNQSVTLREWADRLGGTIVAECVDRVSGTKGTEDRPGLRRVLDLAHRREVDTILVWSLDRLTRSGAISLSGILGQVQRSGVTLRSLRESWLDTSSPLVGELLVSIFGWIARQEREQLIARTKAGLDRAKRRGKILGRPQAVDVEQARQAVARHGSLRRAAAAFGVSHAAIRRRLAAVTAKEVI